MIIVGIFLIWPSSLVQAWFTDKARLDFEDYWLPLLDSPSSSERLLAVQAFLAFPEWGLPLIRKTLDEGGIGLEPWRAAMLLGMFGEKKDISRILKILQNNPQLQRPEVWEGAMERLYWKYRLPPETGLEIIDLNIRKVQRLDDQKKFQRYSTSIEFQLENPSQQTMLIQPHFRFWMGNRRHLLQIDGLSYLLAKPSG